MAAAKVSGGGGDEWLYVDPERVRFQHARIRPYFSGCGRSVVETLESIRREELKPEDLPPIQVSATLQLLPRNMNSNATLVLVHNSNSIPAGRPRSFPGQMTQRAERGGIFRSTIDGFGC
jgi:hypothetical protein